MIDLDMKKGINFLWVFFVFLCVITVLLSFFDCARFVPTDYIGAFVNADGTREDHNGNILTLPEPTGYSGIGLVAICSLICIAAFLSKNLFLNLIGNIVALFQGVFVFCIPLMVKLMGDINDSIVSFPIELDGYYEILAMWYVLSGLCAVIFAYSVFLTAVYVKDKRKKKARSEELSVTR